MTSARLCVVLVEPQGSRNIGSVCRAMMNFGFSDLRLVNPQVDHLAEDARHMAVKAGGLLDNATVFDELSAAVVDCSLVVGTTRRFGKYRENCLMPWEAAGIFRSLDDSSRTAFIFGREDKGLRNSELDLCHRFMTIPTSENLPSMNLAQAVCLCLYEIKKAGAVVPKNPFAQRELAASENMEEMYRRMEGVLLAVDYLNRQNPTHIMRAYRRIFGRAGLDDREVRILEGLWNRIEWLDSERRRLSSVSSAD